MKTLTYALLASLLTLAAPHARADDAPGTLSQQATWTLHLLEAGRCGEAIPAAQHMVDTAPADPLAYQVRGTVGFYVGSLRSAQSDWVEAATLSPRDPATRYALALCSLFGSRPDAARTELTRMEDLLTLSDTQKRDVDTARAYTFFLKGDTTGATLAPPTDTANPSAADPLRLEMAALMTARRQPARGIALLTDFLRTPSGCPRVTEDPGIRARFDISTAPIEPAVTELPLQQMYAASVADNRKGTQTSQDRAKRVSGDAVLDADWTAGQGVSLISFSVDDALIGMVNTPPFRLEWHTASVPNGWHVIRTDALDAAGRIVATHSLTVRVDNAGAALGASGDSTAAVQARLWNLLRLRPARKVAEWTLAALLDARGDTEAASAHRAVAAALDPDYKTARVATRALFRRAGARPLPPSVQVASARPVGLWIGPTGAGKQVALTFDDGPNPLKTPALLDALDKVHCPATFFVVGSRAEAAPELVKRMVARGDDVENHSYTHPNMAQVPPVVAEAEILRASVVIRSLSGRLPRFFRPPGGDSSPALMDLARAYGQTGAFWTEDVLHYEDLGSPQALVDYVLGHLHPGSIVLLHNGADATIAAVPALVDALRARGYTPVTLSQMTGGASGAAPVHAKE